MGSGGIRARGGRGKRVTFTLSFLSLREVKDYYYYLKYAHRRTSRSSGREGGGWGGWDVVNLLLVGVNLNPVLWR